MEVKDLIEKIKEILKFKIFIGKQEINIWIGRVPGGVEKE